ncbi:hypothetical protein PVIIG_05466 [Plasmodium vivax India VII]|uniref:Uncharacterized protein n=1 Tax=Plasmodium vivax India VII TaxID=1077284 RepID=A0A0J9S3A1_PLAVI|nr:hypothetical protein PVIIG_05466 [Plasmodium vivax India VII]
MEDTIYNFTRLFYNAKSIFDEKFNSHDNTYEVSCTNFISDNDLDEPFYKISCLKCMTYIKYLEDENFMAQKNNSVLTVAQALLYLYFWLKDNEFSTKNYNKITLDIYKNLLKSYDQVERSNMHTTYYTKIKDDEIDTLKLIYDLYYKFDNLI